MMVSSQTICPNRAQTANTQKGGLEHAGDTRTSLLYCHVWASGHMHQREGGNADPGTSGGRRLPLERVLFLSQ